MTKTPGQRMMSNTIESWIDLHDSDILAIERGPLAWGKAQEGKRMNIDQFTRDLTEQFAMIGLHVDVQVWDTRQPETYAFEVEIQRRMTPFDPDRQVHEVVNNILDMPGETKGHVIDTGKAMWDYERDKGNGHGR
jgi:hypothetical protein